jgi:spore photoproduct lyase
VVFVNYEDFQEAMDTRRVPGRQTWFFSGYDSDSLVLEPVTGFTTSMLPFFAARPDAWLELRTKSTQVRGLLKMTPIPNAVIAFSFTPEEIYRALEHKVPTLERRLQAMLQLQQAGWQLGLRFDPLIYQHGYQAQYRKLFQQLFSRLNNEQLHSVSLGTFRLPRSYFRNIVQLYPDEPLFAGTFCTDNGMVSYPQAQEQEMTAFCTRELLQHIPESLLFRCTLAA